MLKAHLLVYGVAAVAAGVLVPALAAVPGVQYRVPWRVWAAAAALLEAGAVLLGLAI